MNALFHLAPLGVCVGIGAWDFAVLYVVLVVADKIWRAA